jgi:eukaryotic-like serine/threonine-protein kinase
MTPEQHRAIERLYHQARARPSDLRAAFVADACAGDDAVRLEVESLLAQEVSLPGPLDGGAIGVAAVMLSASTPALSTGQRIGVYQVLERVGVGGMGQVYRARDTLLARDVAIKIVPPALAADAGHLARFEREARVLASLNHPHVAAIYGVEAADDRHALVLEFVDGETLAERIARAPLGVSESLKLARQICDGLEAAHERGIVHRDLKPANVMITTAGVVKVLDFGLAKVLPTEDVADASSSWAGGSRSAIIVGTAAYMSPEQARGQAVDTRGDVWAFGCVLYEMLTRRPAFLAGTIAETLACVFEREPAWEDLPRELPTSIRRLLVRCLQKDSARRLRHIGDARLEIDDAMPTPSTGSSGIASRRVLRRSVMRRWMPILAAVMTGVAGFSLRSIVSPVQSPVVSRSLITTAPFDTRSAVAQGKIPAARPDRTAIAISPDGQTVVWRAQTESGTRLYRRSLDRLDATAIDGTEGADSPFFSADGESLAFWAAGQLKRISLDTGGPPTTICVIPRSGPNGNARIVGASWGDGNRIVFAAQNDRALWQATVGGAVQLIASPGAGEFSYRLPQILPGGEAILFTIVRTMFGWEDAQVAVRSLATGEQKVLLTGAADARYAPSGHIVFMRNGTLMGVAFDLERLEVTGEPVALIEEVMHAVNSASIGTDSGAGQFVIAPQGTLVHATGGIVPQPRRALVWMSRDGSSERLPIAVDAYYSPRISPIDERVAVFTSVLGVPRVWVIHPDSTRNAITTPQERGAYGIWTRDGRDIVFTTGSRMDDIYRKRADGTGGAQRLHDGEYETMASSWTADGKLAIVETHPDTNDDIAIVDVGRSNQPTHLLTSVSREFYRFPELSPDGRWLAYTSNVSARPEVYVQPYPGPGRAVPVSANGGVAPAWRADGKELFYLRPPLVGSDSRLTIVAVNVGDSNDPEVFVPGGSRALFQESSEIRFAVTTPTRNYDVTSDGTKFLMVQQLETPPEPPARIVLVQNWFEELKRLVPRPK